MAFARENEANFAAFLACEASEDARFTYSGYYTAFLYCYNALRKVDAAAANEVWSGACDELRADCAAANSHYKKVEDQRSPRSRTKFTTATCRRSVWNPAASPTVRWSIC